MYSTVGLEIAKIAEHKGVNLMGEAIGEFGRSEKARLRLLVGRLGELVSEGLEIGYDTAPPDGHGGGELVQPTRPGPNDIGRTALSIPEVRAMITAEAD